MTMLKDIKKVHEDERGEIFVIPCTKEKDLAMFKTKKGYARGGCVHVFDDEYFVVIKGKIACIIDDEYLEYDEGMSGMIPRNSPHMTIALTDSILMEWGARRDDKNVYHEDYREKVKKINKKMVDGSLSHVMKLIDEG